MIAVVSHPGKNPQDMYLTFSVPEKFISSVSYRSDSQPLPRIELQLRFFLLDLTTEQKDEFPLNCSARIDDQPIQLPVSCFLRFFKNIYPSRHKIISSIR